MGVGGYISPPVCKFTCVCVCVCVEGPIQAAECSVPRCAPRSVRSAFLLQSASGRRTANTSLHSTTTGSCIDRARIDNVTLGHVKGVGFFRRRPREPTAVPRDGDDVSVGTAREGSFAECPRRHAVARPSRCLRAPSAFHSVFFFFGRRPTERAAAGGAAAGSVRRRKRLGRGRKSDGGRARPACRRRPDRKKATSSFVVGDDDVQEDPRHVAPPPAGGRRDRGQDGAHGVLEQHQPAAEVGRRPPGQPERLRLRPGRPDLSDRRAAAAAGGGGEGGGKGRLCHLQGDQARVSQLSDFIPKCQV